MSTKIGWTDETWNPVTGCSKVSPGCAHCYAETLALTRLAGKPGYPGLPWTPENAERNVVLRADRLDVPLRWRAPRRVFVNSMSDLFHEQVPGEFIRDVFLTMAMAQEHQFQILTKRPRRMAGLLRSNFIPEWAPGLFASSFWPLPNVWLGTSIENQHWADERIPHLIQTPAAVRFLSCEPLLGPIDLTPWLEKSCQVCEHPAIDWIIAGGESGPGFRPMDLGWLRDLVDQADVAGIRVFVKQDSGPRSGKQGRLPADLWARKAYPAHGPKP